MAYSGKSPKPKRMALNFLVIAAVLLFIIMANWDKKPGGTAITSPAPSSSPTDVPYRLALGPDFKPGLSYQDDLGISLVLALDVSGSMKDSPDSGGDGKYLQAAAALGRIVEVLAGMTGPEHPLIKVALLRFSDEVQTVFPLTVLSPTVIKQLRDLAADPANFSPGGKTCIGRALEKGCAILGQSGTIMRSLIIISDGENTVGPEPDQVLAAILADRNDASTADLPVRTASTLIRFVGFDVTASYFNQFAEYGARVSNAADGDQLSQELIRLLNADIKLLE